MLGNDSPILVYSDKDLIRVGFRTSILQGAVLPQMEVDFKLAIAQMNRPRVLVDFFGVEYFPSTGLGSLISMQKQVKGCAGQIRLANLAPHIRELFTLSGLDKVFVICETAEAAATSFDSAG
jgi:anti-anti-sigma factor